MSQLKKTRLVCLPTNKASQSDMICLINKQMNIGTALPIGFNGEPEIKLHHLYGISDEEIKEGDWAIVGNQISKVGKYDEDYKWFTQQGTKKTFKPEIASKVIATSDKSLQIEMFNEGWKSSEDGGWNEYKPIYKNLPQFGDSFIQKWVKEYNKGNVIEWVNLEYEKADTKTIAGLETYNSMLPDVLKLRSDNTVITRHIKDTWTRDEHCTDMQYYMEYCQANGYVTPMKWLDELKHY